MTLAEIEEQGWQLLGTIDLRRTLRKTVQLGDLLNVALERKGMEEYQKWVVRFNLGRRSEQLYRQGAKICAEHPKYLDRFTSLNGLLTLFRTARRAARYENRRLAREEALRDAGPPDKRCRVVCSDCRTFHWPTNIDTVATDPPWSDLQAYRWLGRFASTHLREHGLLLVQCGQGNLPAVLDILRAAGLTHRWSLAIVYYSNHSSAALLPFLCNWRPVLLFSKGEMLRKAIPMMSDTITVREGRTVEKVYHEWQQPLEPWVYWLTRLTQPGSLVSDPFCGSGTTGVALRTIGDRRYLGTEIDPDMAKIARARLRKTQEGGRESSSLA